MLEPNTSSPGPVGWLHCRVPCMERMLVTVRSKRVSLARYTSPIPPPKAATISYGPSVLPITMRLSKGLVTGVVWPAPAHVRATAETSMGASDGLRAEIASPAVALPQGNTTTWRVSVPPWAWARIQ